MLISQASRIRRLRQLALVRRILDASQETVILIFKLKILFDTFVILRSKANLTPGFLKFTGH